MPACASAPPKAVEEGGALAQAGIDRREGGGGARRNLTIVGRGVGLVPVAT